jgi:hypothetical protein
LVHGVLIDRKARKYRAAENLFVESLKGLALSVHTHQAAAAIRRANAGFIGKGAVFEIKLGWYRRTTVFERLGHYPVAYEKDYPLRQ